MQDTDKRCKNCCYYSPRVGYGREDDQGKCHRYPPQIYEVSDAAWPNVREHNWCGEWREKK